MVRQDNKILKGHDLGDHKQDIGENRSNPFCLLSPHFYSQHSMIQASSTGCV